MPSLLKLLGKNSLELHEVGQAVDLLHTGFAGDQRHAVIDEVLGHVGVVARDPLQRDLLLIIGDVFQIEQLIVADIAVLAVAAEADHLAALAAQRGFDGELAGIEGFLDVRTGGAVRRAALQQRQLNAADLCAGGRLDDVRQTRRQTAELGMACLLYTSQREKIRILQISRLHWQEAEH